MNDEGHPFFGFVSDWAAARGAVVHGCNVGETVLRSQGAPKAWDPSLALLVALFVAFWCRTSCVDLFAWQYGQRAGFSMAGPL